MSTGKIAWRAYMISILPTLGLHQDAMAFREWLDVPKNERDAWEAAARAVTTELLEALQALFVDYAESEGCYCGQIVGGTSSEGEPLSKCGYCIAEKAIINAGGTFLPKAEGR